MSINYEKAKARLTELEQEYQNRIDKIEDHIQHPQDDLNEHWDDQAISIRENDMRKSLLVEAQQGLNYVNDALSRIENGTYGECTVCGEEIEDKRLEAVPYATLCMKHAS